MRSRKKIVKYLEGGGWCCVNYKLSTIFQLSQIENGLCAGSGSFLCDLLAKRQRESFLFSAVTCLSLWLRVRYLARDLQQHPWLLATANSQIVMTLFVNMAENSLYQVTGPYKSTT